MAVKMYNAPENLGQVINDKDIPVNVELDPTLALAYEDSKNSAEHVEEVMTELEKAAPVVTAEEPKNPVENVYTKKLKLDESIDDFNLSFADLSDESDEDDYLDYDMFDFVYGIVTDDWPKPKNPLNHPIRKFQHTESDDYKKENEPKGPAQVATDLHGDIIVYADDAAAFNDVRAVCEHYHIECDAPQARKSSSSHWKFNMKIHVPTDTDGYPMMVEDFFEPYGLSMSDVIEDHKVGKGKTANWGSTYETRAQKDREEAAKFANDQAVEAVYSAFVKKAANSNDPLEGFIKDMFAELTDKGLSFSKIKLKKRFLAEFEDDFEDEE